MTGPRLVIGVDLATSTDLTTIAIGRVIPGGGLRILEMLELSVVDANVVTPTGPKPIEAHLITRRSRKRRRDWNSP